MTHYKLMEKVPHAQILVKNQATNLSEESRIYQGNIVYLNDGDNFQIRIFNPLREKIGVRIDFNGSVKNNSLLVLNPGQDVILERFIDENRKMVFETYNVDSNNQAAMEAIQNNGLVDVLFFKEKIKPNYTLTRGVSSSNLYGSFNGATFTTTNCVYDSTLTSSVVNFSDGYKEFETGRIEKGSESNQEFKTVDIEFETYHFQKVSYKLMPVSSKNYEIKEIRNYCPHCRYRIRKENWRYCPKCGQNLDN